MIQKCNLEAGSIEQRRRKGIGFATGGTKKDPVPSEVGNGETGAPRGEARDELQSHACVRAMKPTHARLGARSAPFLKPFPPALRGEGEPHGKPRVLPREPAESGGPHRTGKCSAGTVCEATGTRESGHMLDVSVRGTWHPCLHDLDCVRWCA